MRSYFLLLQFLYPYYLVLNSLYSMIYKVVMLIFKALHKVDNSFFPYGFISKRPPMLESKILSTTKYFADFFEIFEGM